MELNSMIDRRKRKIEQLKELIKTFADSFDDDTIIYHYTTISKLQKILESNEIWMTNTEFVNDTTECKVLQNCEDLFADTDFQNEFVRKEWETFISRDNSEVSNIYMASFSRDSDSLEQWRAYGNFCIGFEAKKLIKKRFYLLDCVYKQKEIKEWILEKEKAEEWSGDCLDESTKQGAALDLMFFASKKLKDENYKNEKEVRLITISNHNWYGYDRSAGMFIDDPPIHFRDNSKLELPIPYVKYSIAQDYNEAFLETEANTMTEEQLKKRKREIEMNQKRSLLPIRKIRIGPIRYQAEAKNSLEIFLSEKGYKSVQINKSVIPYRGF